MVTTYSATAGQLVPAAASANPEGATDAEGDGEAAGAGLGDGEGDALAVGFGGATAGAPQAPKKSATSARARTT